MNFESFKRNYQFNIIKEFPNLVEGNPKVSISLLTYQHKDYIEECLRGILMQQTNFLFEILLAEDDSTDGTREICIEYAQKFPDKIRLFLHHRENNININGNPTGRFNFVYNLYSANGKYLAMCEGDDYWTDPLKLQKQVDFLENNKGFIFSFHDVNVLYTREKRVKNYRMIGSLNKNSLGTNDLLKPWFIPTCSVVFRKPENFSLPKWFYLSPNGDKALWMLLSLEGKFKYLNEIMGVYRMHQNGISASFTGYTHVFSMIHLYKNFNEYTNNKFKTQLHQAMKGEIHTHLPEFHELRSLRRSKKVKAIKIIQAIASKIRGVLG